MSNWLILALLAPALAGLINFIDTYALNQVRDYRGMPIYGAVVAAIFGTAFWLATGRPVPSVYDGSIMIVTGVLMFYALISYFKALSLTETSRISILAQLTPVMILGSSFLVHGETLTTGQLAGFVVVLAAVVGLSWKPGTAHIRLEPYFYFVLLSDAFLAAAAVIVKFASNINSFGAILSYQSWGIFLGGLTLLVFPSVRHAFIASLGNAGPRVLPIMFVNEILFIASKAMTSQAFIVGPVALVSVLGTTQAFYAIFYGWTFTLTAPSVFREDISGAGLAKKTVTSGVLLAGIWLIYRS
jgi:drug/metabolite transporter (DMT)-like permease